MTRDKIDQLWAIALKRALDAGEPVFTYHFAGLMLEEAAKVCEEMFSDGALNIADAIRAMKPEVKT